MEAQFDLAKMDRQIQDMKHAAETLAQMGERFPAVARNTARILASIKMLELNICDVSALIKSGLEIKR